MAVVGGDQNERLFRVGVFDRRLNGVGEFHRIGQGALGVTGVVTMVDTTRLDDQQIALVILLQNLERFRCHLGQ